MNTIVLRENLIKALGIVGRSISTKPQLPILSHILITARNNQLTLTATNLEIGTSTTIGAKTEKQGEVVVPGKLLMEFVSSLPSSAEKIELSVDGHMLMIRTNKTKSSFATGNVSDFPPIPTIETSEYTLPFESLKESLLRVAFAASTDDTRPVLTGVRMKTVLSKSGHPVLSLIATDGYRLSLEDVVLSKSAIELDTLIPASSLLEVVRIAVELKVKEIGCSLIPNKNQVAFLLPDALIITRLIDGEFPSVDRIIPQSFKTKVTVDTEDLARSVKTASLFARGSANIIKFKAEKGQIVVSANAPQVGSNEDVVEADVEGEDVEMAFNYRFLLDVLAHFPDKQVVFESSGSLNPGVFKPKSPTPSFLHVIMPVRVQG